MSEHKDFAAIVRASNGQQVLFYKEFGGDDGNTLHCIASFDGYSADLKISRIPDGAFEVMDLAKAGAEMADKIVAQVAELAG